MRITLVFALLSFSISSGYAQLLDGAKLNNDITFTDLNGTSHSVYYHCRVGRNVLIKLFKVNDDSSWTHHQRRSFQSFYPKYKWNNYAFMLETSSATNSMLDGTTGSLGNWKSGNPVPISVLTISEKITNPGAFFAGGTGNLDTSILCLICADSMTYQIPYTADSSEIKNMIKTKCKFFEESLVYIEDENIRSNVSAIDLYDSTVNFVQTISQNKAIVVSFFKGNSSSEWKQNEKKYLQDYYLKYEKTGPRDSKVYMMEIDPKTKKDDLLGFGTGPGDWTRTNDFSVTNLDSFQDVLTTLSAFIKDGRLDTIEQINSPLNFVVCNDNKVYRFDTSFNTQEIRDLVTVKCFKWALGVSNNETGSEFYLSEDGYIYFEAANRSSKDFSFNIYNAIGQLVYHTNQKDPVSIKDLKLSRGLYILNQNENGKLVSKKVVF